MRLTLKTDYALRTLMYLGQQRGRLTSIASVAEFYGISENHLVKVVHELGRKGFIETLRGKGGGIRLLRQPSDIIIGDVVRAMEDDMALVACFGPQEPERACLLTDSCSLQGLLHQALRAFMATLDAHSLADMLGHASAQRAEGMIPLQDVMREIQAQRPGKASAPAAVGDASGITVAGASGQPGDTA